ncbi:MAG: IS200/IS605 family transposase [Verrucomicrobia bacterium]|nr:IS200/IS605 family transposase [Verrucomicrobiota bacterium]MCH8510019.1 IS200/IS605 family transposase [Kiritimatiellia bacterium]
MPQSISKIAIHLIYSTKNRHPFLTSEEMRVRVVAYQVGIFKQLDCPSIRTKVMPDHVHSLFLLGRTQSVADVVKNVKKDSSAWVKEHAVEWSDSMLRKFAWQTGYGAFSVSESNISKVIRYIEQQEEHHRKKTFQEEYRAFLEKHQIPYDERYIWD